MKKLLQGLSLVAVVVPALAVAQPRPPRDTVLVARRDSLEREIHRIGIVERKVMVPMRDGVRMQADVYRPRAGAGSGPFRFAQATRSIRPRPPEQRAPNGGGSGTADRRSKVAERTPRRFVIVARFGTRPIPREQPGAPAPGTL